MTEGERSALDVVNKAHAALDKCNRIPPRSRSHDGLVVRIEKLLKLLK